MRDSAAQGRLERGSESRAGHGGEAPARWRRWRLLVGLAAAANLVALGLVAAPSQAQPQPSLCSGSAQGLTIAGDLAVPAGEACELVDTTVTGDVVVRAGATLFLEGATLQGGLTVRTDGFVDAVGSRVGGATTVRQAFGVAVENSILDSAVDARGSGFFLSDSSAHGGDVFSRAGQTVIVAGRVDGDVRTNQDLFTDLSDLVVTGGVTVNRATFGSVVCRSEIDGPAGFRNSSDLIQIGTGPILGCEFNVFGADLMVRDNDARIEITGNVIRGDLTCTGNTTAPSGSDNRVRGQATGQCADLAPAPATAPPALSSPAAQDAESRTAGIRADIERRTAQAGAAVAEAGAADLS